MAGLVGLVKAIADGPFGKTTKMVCTALDADGSEIPDMTWSPQFYPETLSVQMSADFAEKQVIGGSTTLKSWSNTSGRTINFTLLVAREMKRKEDMPGIVGTVFLVDPQSTLANNAEYNYDVRQEVARWQAMMLPSYSGSSDEDILVKPPPVLMLTIPGMGWGLSGDSPDTIYAVVTSLSIEYVRLFTDAKEKAIPKQARIDISLSEVVQVPGQNIRFFGIEDIQGHSFFGETDG